MIYDQFIAELRDRATQAGSVRQAALDLGLDPATLHRWLNGQTQRANLHHVLSVAERLGWSKKRRNALVEEFTEEQQSHTLDGRLAALEQRVGELGRTVDELIEQMRTLLEQVTRQPRR